MATHPLQALGEAIGGVGGDPRALQLSSLFQGANDGPARTAAKLTGVQEPGKRADDGPYFTNNEGIPFPDGAHSKTAGEFGEDGSSFGAFGYFETTKDMSHLTKADFLKSPGLKTPVFMRFSTVTLGREFPDLARNPRGFAIKFYTGEGNYDVPVFFCRDPIQGPDVIRSQYRNPQNFLLDHNSLFDLLANTPEGNHAALMYFSDHGTPVGWRNQHGYGCHTFKWVNKDGTFVYIKYHFLVDKGQKQFTADEALQFGGQDPDFSKRDLWQAIEKGEQVSWTAHVQIMKPEEADPRKLGFDPFDVTKVWPKKQFPLHRFGKLHFNKNPENYHRDVEQAAFSPGSMVPGIEDSPDPLLQFRMFFYRDAQYHRIGINLHQVPGISPSYNYILLRKFLITRTVNCPFMASSYSSLNFDGPLRVDANHAMNPQYAPNSFANKFRPDTAECPYALGDNTVSRKSHFYHEGKASEYEQPRELYRRVMDAKSRARLHSNTARLLRLVEYQEIVVKYLVQVYCVAGEYAKGVYELLPEPGFGFEEVERRVRGAAGVGKEKKFLPTDGEVLMGTCPKQPIYTEVDRV
ncbi:catalase [Aspergillus chevalieri]|uniref:Catalase core domain-containing protein n=1 Tax=Aspergillus chevalieri TaxID=182096 RepID=A0A7R7VRY7_ASPCH|nr:uncharacterized protein ACHE_50928S [Aspergillus chevalieri]BCR89730.1 hypothetical protein ACHE_50928S [Aspergillus chevalieri]